MWDLFIWLVEVRALMRGLFGLVAGTMQSVGIGAAPNWDFKMEWLWLVFNTAPVLLCRMRMPV